MCGKLIIVHLKGGNEITTIESLQFDFVTIETATEKFSGCYKLVKVDLVKCTRYIIVLFNYLFLLLLIVSNWGYENFSFSTWDHIEENSYCVIKLPLHGTKY